MSTRSRKQDPYDYAKGKLFGKIIAAFLICAAVSVGMLRFQNRTYSIIPGIAALIAAALGVYYLFLFRRDCITSCTCRIMDKKKDVLGGILSGLSFNKNRYYFEYQSDDGSVKQFFISRGGILHDLSVGQTYMVLYRRGREPSADNFIEYVSIDDVTVGPGPEQAEDTGTEEKET